MLEFQGLQQMSITLLTTEEPTFYDMSSIQPLFEIFELQIQIVLMSYGNMHAA